MFRTRKKVKHKHFNPKLIININAMFYILQPYNNQASIYTLVCGL